MFLTAGLLTLPLVQLRALQYWTLKGLPVGAPLDSDSVTALMEVRLSHKPDGAYTAHARTELCWH